MTAGTEDLRDALAKALCAVETRSKAATLEEVVDGIERWTRHRYEAERLMAELVDYGVTLAVLSAPQEDEWCREEGCTYRHWRSGSMPTHRRGADCPEPSGNPERLPAPQEGDARERLHAKCDCVPDLGPAHCHLCGNEKGEPVPWAECSAVRAAAPEPEWEYARQNRYGNVCEPDDSREQAEYRASLGGGYDTVVRRPLVWWEPLPVGGDDE